MAYFVIRLCSKYVRARTSPNYRYTGRGKGGGGADTGEREVINPKDSYTQRNHPFQSQKLGLDFWERKSKLATAKNWAIGSKPNVSRFMSRSYKKLGQSRELVSSVRQKGLSLRNRQQNVFFSLKKTGCYGDER